MNRRVVLIDSDQGFRDTLIHELAGYRVDVTYEPDADRAIDHATADPPALIVLAVEEAAKKAGFRAFERCKKGALSSVPIILTTATVPADAFVKHKSLKTHADEYIDKRSMSTHELIGKIDGLITLGDPEVIAVDEVPMEIADGDVVLDELEPGPAARLAEAAEEFEDFDAHGARTVGPNDGLGMDEVVGAETDAAFAALTDDSVPEHVPSPNEPEPEAAPATAAPEPSHDGRGRGTTPPPLSSGSIPSIIIDDSLPADEPPPAPLPHATPPGPDPTSPIDVVELARLAVESTAVPEGPITPSSGAIPIEDDDVLALDADVPVEDVPVEDVPVEIEPPDEPAAEAPAPAAVVAAPARRTPSETSPPPVTPRTITGSGAHPAIDLGLDALAEDARNEQSGVYDRRALRKIGELERQLAQLKSELDRARAAGDASAKGGREAQFLKLREQMLAKDKELSHAKDELRARDGELADTREKLRVAQHAKQTLETKNGELERRILDSGSQAVELEASAQTAAAEAQKLGKQLEQASAAHAAAEAARAELEHELTAERARREASAGEAERALVAEREQLVARHQAAAAAAEQRAADALEAARREAETALADALAELRQKLDREHATVRDVVVADAQRRLADEHDAAIAQLQKTHAERTAKLERDHAERHEALRAELTAQSEGLRGALAAAEIAQQDALVAAAAEHATALEAAQAEHATALETAQAGHATAIAAAQQAHRGELDQVRTDAQHAIAERDAALAAAHQAAFTKQAADHAAALEQQAADHAAALEQQAADHAAALEQQAADHGAAAERQTAEHGAAIATQAAEHRAALEQQASEHAAAIAGYRADAERRAAAFDAERDRLVAAAETAQGELREQLRAQLAEAEARHARTHGELAGERDQLEHGLSSARSAHEQTKAELAVAAQAIADRTAELHAHVQAIAERDERIAELRKELEAIEVENASYQDQVLRAYQKIKQDEAMVTRAKKAMAIALTVLDDEPSST